MGDGHGSDGSEAADSEQRCDPAASGRHVGPFYGLRADVPPPRRPVASRLAVSSPENPRTPRHILLLTDRDWTHPQGGGTGTNLFGQVSRWVAWGHRVTVIAGSDQGVPQAADQITVIGPALYFELGTDVVRLERTR